MIIQMSLSLFCFASCLLPQPVPPAKVRLAQEGGLSELHEKLIQQENHDIHDAARSVPHWVKNAFGRRCGHSDFGGWTGQRTTTATTTKSTAEAGYKNCGGDHGSSRYFCLRTSPFLCFLERKPMLLIIRLHKNAMSAWCVSMSESVGFVRWVLLFVFCLVKLNLAPTRCCRSTRCCPVLHW